MVAKKNTSPLPTVKHQKCSQKQFDTTIDTLSSQNKDIQRIWCQEVVIYHIHIVSIRMIILIVQAAWPSTAILIVNNDAHQAHPCIEMNLDVLFWLMAAVSIHMSVSHHWPRQGLWGESVGNREFGVGWFSGGRSRRESTWKWDPFIPLPITPPTGIWHGIVLGHWARSDAICWHALSFHKLPIPLRTPENNNRRHERAVRSPASMKPCQTHSTRNYIFESQYKLKYPRSTEAFTTGSSS